MIRKSTNELLIKPKVSNNIRLLLTGVGVILLLIALYLAFTAGIRSGNEHFDADKSMIGQLNGKVNDLQVQLDAAKEELVNSQLQKQIQEEAYKQMSNAYASSEQKNRYLGSRLNFYRSIISPENGKKGPIIQSLEQIKEGQALKFTLTLVQSINHKSQVRGNVRVSLHADAAQSENALKWPESNARSVNFQYFQQFSGEFSVEDLADDARIKVEFTLQDGTALERWFDVGAV